jgi:two-component system, NtrC family, response regulator AtoC
VVVALARRVASVPAAAILVVTERGGPADALARLIHLESGGDPSRGWISVDSNDHSEAPIEAALLRVAPGTPGTTTPTSAADRGSCTTLFIDSIHSLSLADQARLSMLLLSIRDPAAPLIVRLIASTRVDLMAAVTQQRFRSDLCDHLSDVTITIPPLRKRPGDIGSLATLFARAEAQALGRRFEGFSQKALAILSSHTYPGNEDELRRTVKQALAATTGSTIGASAIDFGAPDGVAADVFVADVARSVNEATGRSPTLSEIERAYVIWALRHTNLNRTAAARLLGVSYPTIAKKISDYHIDTASLGELTDRAVT